MSNRSISVVFNVYGQVGKILKVRQSRNDFFKLTFLPKKRTNEFDFTSCFCSFFWKKLTIPKRRFKIN